MEYCSPCSKDGKNSPAKKFCINCEENLCLDCMEAHRKFKLFQNHSLVEIGLSFSFSFGKTCKLHSDYEMDFFCTRHDSVCCATCVSSDHRQCDTVTPLQQASAGVKSSEVRKDTSEELKEMLNATNAVIWESSSNMDRIDKEAERIREAIKEMKLKMIKKLDEAEKELLDELSDKKSKLIQKIRDDIKKADDSKTVIEKLIKQLELLTEHGSENQLFVFLYHIHGDLIKQSAKVDECVSNLTDRSLQFIESSPKLEFGRIDETSKPCTVTYQKKKQVKAQLPLLNPIRPVKSFKFDKKFKTPRTNSIYVGVTGILTRSDHIIVCNQEQIVTYDNDGNQVSSIQLPGTSWDIARNGDNGDIVVTMRGEGAVRLVDKTVTKIPELEGKICWGIEWANGCVYLGGYREVNVYDGNLKHVKSSEIGTDNIECIHYVQGTFYLTDFSSVSRVTEDGIEIFSFSSPDLVGSQGIASDACGNVYVVGRYSNNVHKLSTDGKTSEIVLSEKDGLKAPIAIAFSQDYKKLFLSNHCGIEVLMFDVEY